MTVDPGLGKYINGDGAYVPPFRLDDYFNGKKEAYVIMDNDQAVGFAAFVNDEVNHSYLIEEAFVVAAFRGQGFFTSIFNNYFEGKTGSLWTHVLNGDVKAQKLIKKLFDEKKLVFKKEELDLIAWKYTVEL